MLRRHLPLGVQVEGGKWSAGVMRQILAAWDAAVGHAECAVDATGQ